MTKTKSAAIGAAVLTWGLAACGSAPPPVAPATTNPATPLASTSTAPTPVTPAPVEGAPRHPPLPSLALGPPASEPRPAPPMEDMPGPGSLIGLTADAVTAVLGAPQFRRSEAPAEVWHYRTKTCFLDLFLYRDGAALTVTHIEARGHDVAAIGKKACYLGLLVEKSRAKAL